MSPRQTANGVRAAADAVREAIAPRQAKVAVVLGSGLGFLGESVEQAVRVPYGKIPGFPQPGVAGHAGELIAGTLDGVPVLMQSGRFHLYEGHAPNFAVLGATTAISVVLLVVGYAVFARGSRLFGEEL